MAEANEVLQRYVPSNSIVKYNLDTMQELMQALGNPQESYPVIHVAGTSGKTSTTYYAAALLRAAGKRVGHSVSPHIDSLAERVQINLQPLDETQYCRQLSKFLEILNKLSTKPSYFELLVAFAYWEFANQNVDYAVVEVGLGGRLDGTNVIANPNKVGVITDIGFDHMKILGGTLPKIAAEKAGITHSGNHIFILEQPDEVVQSIRDTVQARGGTLHVLQQQATQWSNLVLFQQRNWSLAKQVVDFVLERDGSPMLSREQAEQSTHITVPARMELVAHKGQTLVLDGSHNGQKIASLVAAFQQKFPSQKVPVLLSLVQDKTSVLDEVLRQLLPITSDLIVTEFHGQQDLPKQSMSAKDVAAAAERQGFTEIELQTDPERALQKLISKPGDVKLVTGSLYLLNHIRPVVLT